VGGESGILAGEAEAGQLESARAADAALPGRIGRFEVRELLGSGTCATVYRAFDPDLERDVAVKVPHAGAIAGAKAIKRFLVEAKTLARMRHRCIVPIFEVGMSRELPFLASAYIPGSTLADVLERGALGVEDAVEIGADLAEALAHAHSHGVVHRDVKPANVLVDECGHVLLTDFGLAQRSCSARRARAGALTGTPAYLAPELASDTPAPAAPASDQYSLGVVLYHLICGRVPFLGPPALVVYSALHDEPPPPRMFRAGVPRALERICLKAMARRPSDRYPTCQALADDLRRWRAGRRPEAAGSSLGLVVDTLRRRRGLTVSATLAAIVIASALVTTRPFLRTTRLIPQTAAPPFVPLAKGTDGSLLAVHGGSIAP
jgi:serine/threonine protein kinase